MFWPNYELSPTWISLKHLGVPWNSSKKATRYQNWGVSLSSPTSLSNKLTRSEVIPSQLHLTLQLNSSNKLIKPSATATDSFPSQMFKLEEGCCCWVFSDQFLCWKIKWLENYPTIFSMKIWEVS